MKSLNTRLDDKKGQVLKFTKLFGRGAAMDEYGVRDYVCFADWLKEVTQDENFGLNPTFGSRGNKGILNQVAIKVIRTLLDLQAENEELRKRNSAMSRELSHDNGNNHQEALSLLETLEV